MKSAEGTKLVAEHGCVVAMAKDRTVGEKFNGEA
jgi:hypothetical protein